VTFTAGIFQISDWLFHFCGADFGPAFFLGRRNRRTGFGGEIAALAPEPHSSASRRPRWAAPPVKPGNAARIDKVLLEFLDSGVRARARKFFHAV
jgi:hypothetical protein